MSRLTKAFIGLAALVCMACLAGCVYDPTYQGAHCGPAGACPQGYHCDPIEKICTRGDEESPAEEPGPADGDAGPDAGDPAADDGPDAGDPGLDGSDPGADPGGDAGPCGECPPAFWCDEIAGSCKPCNDSSHCGRACLPCEQDQTCTNLSADGFCCLGPCGYPNACQRVDCNGRDYICKAFFPLTYTWIAFAHVTTMICALSDQDGIVGEYYGCDPADPSRLQYFCPWGGSCQPDGTCQPDEAYDITHPCGQQFGCDQDHCRMHLIEEKPCSFNYDCESFCCSRTAESVCLPAGDPSQCKLSKSLFWRTLTDLRSFEASAAVPHDRSGWSSSDSNSSPHCDNADQCDSGHCRYFVLVTDDRCELPDCVSKGSDSDIRNSYFCEISNHEITVTNQDPWPETPAGCIYQE